MTHFRILGVTSLYSAYVWAVYGVVEYYFAGLSHLVEFDDYFLAGWHWKLTGVLLALYVLTGGVAGIVAGAIYSLAARAGVIARKYDICRAAGALTLVAAFGANLLSAAHSTTFLLYIAVCILPALALTAQMWQWRTFNVLEGFTNPWAISLCLLFPVWLGRVWMADSSRVLKLVALIVAEAALVALVMAWQRLLPAISPLRAFSSAIVLAVLASIALDREKPLPAAAELSRQKPTQVASQPLPNVVLIVLDTVRADHLSVYGYHRNTTPNLARLAQEATLYKHAIATSDMTLGTHASLFTGMYASWHGAHFAPPDFKAGRSLDHRYETLAEVLARYGYRTLGVSANTIFLIPAYALDQGFDYFDVRRPVPISILGRPFYLRRLAFRLPAMFSSLTYSMRRADAITQEGRKLIDTYAEPGTPFLLFLNYFDAHMPYAPPLGSSSMFPGVHEFYSAWYIERLRHDIVRGKRTIRDSERRHVSAQYDGLLFYLDAQLGELFKYLKKRGEYDDALIIVTADHGEALGEHNLLEHAVSVYQDQVYVPLIIKYPGQKRSEVVASPASQVDVLPTILSQLGLPIPTQVQGKSLIGLSKDEPRDIFSESFPDLNDGLNRIERAIFRDSHKLIVSTSGKREFYDLSSDPHEEHNLYGRSGMAARDLEARLAEWVRKAPSHTRQAPSITKDTMERLRSLGYVQ